IRDRIPSLHVIIYTHSGIPLGNLINNPVFCFLPTHSIRPIPGNRESIFHTDLYLIPGSLHCEREPDLHTCIRNDRIYFIMFSFVSYTYFANMISAFFIAFYIKTVSGYRCGGCSAGVWMKEILIQL